VRRRDVVLYPEARAANDAAAEEPEVWEVPVDVARLRDRAVMDAVPRQAVAEVLAIDAAGVPCRLYRPEGSRGGTVVHVHGGGFVFGDLETQDAACRSLANSSARDVLSIGYRLAPEHPFPAARDDIDAVLRWLVAAGDLVREPLFGHGDSAGANLILVAALRHPGRFRALVLLYPFLDPHSSFESYQTETDGFPRSRAQWFWDQYLTRADDPDDPDVSPLRSQHLAVLPPTLCVTAEHDPLRDEGEALAAQLALAGVPVIATRYLGQIHAFWNPIGTFSAAQALDWQIAGFLRQSSNLGVV
jgi:acetyl esterase